jgi:hypothetical protein
VRRLSRVAKLQLARLNWRIEQHEQLLATCQTAIERAVVLKRLAADTERQAALHVHRGKRSQSLWQSQRAHLFHLVASTDVAVATAQPWAIPQDDALMDVAGVRAVFMQLAAVATPLMRAELLVRLRDAFHAGLPIPGNAVARAAADLAARHFQAAGLSLLEARAAADQGWHP